MCTVWMSYLEYCDIDFWAGLLYKSVYHLGIESSAKMTHPISLSVQQYLPGHIQTIYGFVKNDYN